MTRPRILVVEDDREIRETLLDILDEHGFEPVGAANGKAALEVLGRDAPRPVLILLDLMMPVMDGKAFRDAQIASPELAAIPVVVLSAYRDAGAQGERIGAAATLAKPIRLDELLRLIRALVVPSAVAS